MAIVKRDASYQGKLLTGSAIVSLLGKTKLSVGILVHIHQ